ncbi:hypothetical protein GCM10017779_61880 [Streptomyces capillispiralis]|uniref:Uncharacterized protein n=1 Tax=Streptomyces capillispiralis TaxID=68182 RepID=A0A561TS20_9ACTN|nr:hypothetical protein FHX78_116953 [Streptomyces capillispiralis]GHH95731.1 hypothetical protein GCM10017779_61880 [Streptomyces capillispiralis]
MADVQHRAHLTWVEGPQMHLTVLADERAGEDDPNPASEGYWEADGGVRPLGMCRSAVFARRRQASSAADFHH